MDIKGKFPNGLAEAMREADDIGATELAKLVKSTKQTITRYRDASRKIPPPMGEKLGRVLNRTAAEIVMPPGSLAAVQRVRLISWLSAGNLGRGGEPQAELGTVLTADLPKGDWVAFRVEGTSMDRISPPDSIILVNRKDKRLVPNACYVVVDDEGGASYKRYRPKPDRFEPVSTFDEHRTIFKNEVPITVFGRVMRTMLNL